MRQRWRCRRERLCLHQSRASLPSIKAPDGGKPSHLTADRAEWRRRGTKCRGERSAALASDSPSITWQTDHPPCTRRGHADSVAAPRLTALLIPAPQCPRHTVYHCIFSRHPVGSCSSSTRRAALPAPPSRPMIVGAVLIHLSVDDASSRQVELAAASRPSQGVSCSQVPSTLSSSSPLPLLRALAVPPSERRHQLPPRLHHQP